MVDKNGLTFLAEQVILSLQVCSIGSFFQGTLMSTTDMPSILTCLNYQLRHFLHLSVPFETELVLFVFDRIEECVLRINIDFIVRPPLGLPSDWISILLICLSVFACDLELQAAFTYFRFLGHR